MLGVHYGACEKTVKLAYRKMARRYHPDVSKIHDAQRRFQEIALAYEILSKYRDAYCQEYNLRKTKNRDGVKPDAKSSNKSQSRGGFSQRDDSRSNTQQNEQQSNENDSSSYRSAFRSQKPINGKNRIITYPITLRYAIRLLNLGTFYIPGLKVKMKFTREVFEGKTFRLEGRGYSGLFGGKPGDFLVKFNIEIDSAKYKLKDADIYSTFLLPKSLLKPGQKVAFDAVSGKVELTVPVNYSAEKFIKVIGKGLPADNYTVAGNLYARLVAN